MQSATAPEAAAAPQVPAPLAPPDWIIAADRRGWRWALINWTRAAAQPGAWFDAAKADAVVASWPDWFRLTEDRFIGVPFRLNAWQEVVVRMLVGWKVPTEVVDPLTGETRFEHVRLFRRLMLWVPRKNGKSEFLAALSLLFWALEGVGASQGFCFAADEKQAKIVFTKMKTMVSLNPKLAEKITTFGKSLWCPQIMGSFELLTGKAAGKHGRSPTVITGDEIHEWASTDLSDNLRQGTGARLQPIELYASTAGLRSNEVGKGQYDECESILDGRIDEPTTLVVMFAASPDDDWLDEAVWRAANPSLGLSPTLAFLRREAALAKDRPTNEANFRRYHLNQWVEALIRWLSIKRWDACAKDSLAWKRYPEELRGRRCYGAFDVSSTRDVTALTWLFPPEDDKEPFRLVSRFWVPEDTMKARVRTDRVDYDKWVQAEAMETTPGDYVDQSFVQHAIEEGFEAYDVQQLGYDPWNSTKLIADLQTKSGIDADQLIVMRQGIPTLGGPTKEMERLVYAGLFDHGGHPVLRWMANHVQVRFDENMNFAPAKKRSREKIDGIVTSVMATGLTMQGVDMTSVYESRGLVEVEV